MSADVDFIEAFEDSDWTYYSRGHDDDALLQIDEKEALEWEHLWMRPVAASSLDYYDGETVIRGPDGRFQPVTCWLECSEASPGAEAWTGVRYRRG